MFYVSVSCQSFHVWSNTKKKRRRRKKTPLTLLSQWHAHIQFSPLSNFSSSHSSLLFLSISLSRFSSPLTFCSRWALASPLKNEGPIPSRTQTSTRPASLIAVVSTLASPSLTISPNAAREKASFIRNRVRLTTPAIRQTAKDSSQYPSTASKAHFATKTTPSGVKRFTDCLAGQKETKNDKKKTFSKINLCEPCDLKTLLIEKECTLF